LEEALPGKPRFREIIVAALVAGAIVELALFSLEWMGFGQAIARIAEEAHNGLIHFTPGRLAAGFSHMVSPSHGPIDPRIIPQPPLPPYHINPLALFLPLIALIVYPFYLIASEPWPAAFVDIVQLAAGTFTAVLVYVGGPWRTWTESESGFIGKGVKSVIFVVLVFVCTSMLSLAVLAVIYGLSEVISFAIPTENALPITYGSIVGGGAAFVSHRSIESVLHERILGMVRRK
jgi:hypothetical protein